MKTVPPTFKPNPIEKVTPEQAISHRLLPTKSNHLSQLQHQLMALEKENEERLKHLHHRRLLNERRIEHLITTQTLHQAVINSSWLRCFHLFLVVGI